MPRTTAAAEFLDELSRHRQPTPQPLPIEYRPLATAIVGERQPVRVSTSHASRRALARVGKRAATTGDTIHLDRPRPTPQVIAHELTHVAHPSPAPRFFDDDDRGPEERQAEQVAAVMRRAPILPMTSAAAMRTETTARTSPTPPATRGRGTVSAAALAASITGPTSSGNVQRKEVDAPAAPAPTSASTIRRAETRTPTQTIATLPPAPSTSNAASEPLDQPSLRSNPAESRAQFELILELLEERILAQLERRGGRYRGGF